MGLHVCAATSCVVGLLQDPKKMVQEQQQTHALASIVQQWLPKGSLCLQGQADAGDCLWDVVVMTFSSPLAF